MTSYLNDLSSKMIDSKMLREHRGGRDWFGTEKNLHCP